MSTGAKGFKDHFSTNSAGYAAARPLYPAALFDWLASQCPHRALAWDAGCGNGQASLALAARFDAVYASDPSVNQITSAIPAPNIRYVVEPAESCSLGDACADLVTVAQAMHWFDVPRFQSEVRRVLQAGGLFAAWTYARSQVNPEVDVPFLRLHDELLDAWWPEGRLDVLDGYAHLPFAFERVHDVPRFEMRCEWNLGQFIAYLRSWSASSRYARATGTDAICLIQPELGNAWGDPAEFRTVTWPLTVHVGRSN